MHLYRQLTAQAFASRQITIITKLIDLPSVNGHTASQSLFDIGTLATYTLLLRGFLAKWPHNICVPERSSPEDDFTCHLSSFWVNQNRLKHPTREQPIYKQRAQILFANKGKKNQEQKTSKLQTSRKIQRYHILSGRTTTKSFC